MSVPDPVSRVRRPESVAAAGSAAQPVASGVDGTPTVLRMGLDIGSTTIRNVRAPVDVVIIDSGSSHQDHVDPVCRVHLSADARHSAATHEDRLYWFCSPLCAEQFVRRPQTYVPEGAAVSALRDNAESPCC